jgi:polyribonucleotide nucleotidyltransferase
MRGCLDSPQPLKDSIPKIMEFAIAPDALGKVIGPKGALI